MAERLFVNRKMSVTWIILTSIAILSLVMSFKGRRNAVWGGLTIGTLLGLAAALACMFFYEGFHWGILGKCMVVFVLIGLGTELRGKIANRAKKKKQ